MSEAPQDAITVASEPVPQDDPLAIKLLWNVHAEYLGDKDRVKSMIGFIASLFGTEIRRSISLYFCSIFSASISQGLQAVRDSILDDVNKPFHCCLVGLYLKHSKTNKEYVVLRYCPCDETLHLVQLSQRPYVQVKDKEFLKPSGVLVIGSDDFDKYKPVKESKTRERLVLGTHPPPSEHAKRVEIPFRKRNPSRKREPGPDHDAEFVSEEDYTSDECEEKGPPRKRFSAAQKRVEREFQAAQASDKSRAGTGEPGSTQAGEPGGTGKSRNTGEPGGTGKSRNTGEPGDTGGWEVSTKKASTGEQDSSDAVMDLERRELIPSLHPALVAACIPDDMIPVLIKELQLRLKRERATEEEMLKKDYSTNVWTEIMREAPKNHRMCIEQKRVQGSEDNTMRFSRTTRVGNLVPMANYLESYLDFLKDEVFPAEQQALSEPGITTQALREPKRRQHLISIEQIFERRQQLTVPRILTPLAFTPPDRHRTEVFVALIRASETQQWSSVFNKNNRLGAGPRDELLFAVVGNPWVMAKMPKSYRDNLGLEPTTSAWENKTFWRFPHVDEPGALEDDDMEILCTKDLVEMCIHWDKKARENLSFGDAPLHDRVTQALYKYASDKVEFQNIRAEKHNALLDRIENMTPEELAEYNAELLEKQKKSKHKPKANHWAGKRMAMETAPERFHVILIPISCLPLCCTSMEFAHSSPCACHGYNIKNPFTGTLGKEYYKTSAQSWLGMSVSRKLLDWTCMLPFCLVLIPNPSKSFASD